MAKVLLNTPKVMDSKPISTAAAANNSVSMSKRDVAHHARTWQQPDSRGGAQ